MSEFRNSRVVVTGACGVFGRRIAAAFAEAGAGVCLSDNRADRLEEVQAALPGGPHLAHATELTDTASIDALIDHVAASWDGADIVVNNAGVYPSGLLIDLPVEEWDRIWAVNVRAPFLVARGFARLMAARRIAGSIINIGSGAARNMRATTVHYCASKTALDRLTKGMALEFAPFGIRVNAVSPGVIDTEIQPKGRVESVGPTLPMGRAGRPEEVAKAILWLLSDDASYVSGSNLNVTGAR